MAIDVKYDENQKRNRGRRNNYVRDVSGNPYAEDIDALGIDEDDEVDVEEEEESLEDVLRKYEEEGLREGETREDRDRRLKILRKQEKLRQKELGRSKALGTLKLSSGRLFSLLITGILWCVIIAFADYTLYMRWIKYPPQQKFNHKMYGMYCLENWMGCLKERDSGKIATFIEDKSYLEEETKYANSSSIRIDFFNKMLDTVKYTPDEVDVYNIYGNLYIDKKTGKTIKKNDEVTIDSTVSLSYIDYASVEIDKAHIKEMLEVAGLTLGDAGYSEKLTDIFCDYMCNYVELPIKTDSSYSPHFLVNMDGTYALSNEEDIYLDKLLFSSDEFYDLLERFSLAAGEGALNPEWSVWSVAKQTMSSSFIGSEPAQYFKSLPINQDWLTWNSSSAKKEEDEPYKYKPDYVIGHFWCGSYFLQNEYFEWDSNGNKVYKAITAPLGNGTFENPASLNTEILTTTPWTGPSSSGLNTTLDMPISVKMVDYGVSEKALSWFESKDERNRGHDVKSELQFVYYVFEVKNLSNRPLVINDNSSLVDSGINMYPRTGNIYGLTSQISLNPGEVGIIESWSSSTVLNRLYVIWGANFKRKQDVIWFRQLQGNLEDDSWNKGVSINTSRQGEETLASLSNQNKQTEVPQGENSQGSSGAENQVDNQGSGSNSTVQNGGSSSDPEVDELEKLLAERYGG